MGPPANSDKKSFALRGAPTVCALEVLCLSAWHLWRRRHLSTLRLHFLDLNWRFVCRMLPRLMKFVQFLWLNWTRSPGCDPDWPESGPVSFPACPAGTHPPTRLLADQPPDPSDWPFVSTPLRWPLQPLWASPAPFLVHAVQTHQTDVPG